MIVCRKKSAIEDPCISHCEIWTDRYGEMVDISNIEGLKSIYCISLLNVNGREIQGCLNLIGSDSASKLIFQEGFKYKRGIKVMPGESSISNVLKSRRTEIEKFGRIYEFDSYEVEIESEDVLQGLLPPGSPRKYIDALIFSNKKPPEARWDITRDIVNQYYNMEAIPGIVQEDEILVLFHEQDESYSIRFCLKDPSVIEGRINEFLRNQ